MRVTTASYAKPTASTPRWALWGTRSGCARYSVSTSSPESLAMLRPPVSTRLPEGAGRAERRDVGELKLWRPGPAVTSRRRACATLLARPNRAVDRCGRTRLTEDIVPPADHHAGPRLDRAAVFSPSGDRARAARAPVDRCRRTRLTDGIGPPADHRAAPRLDRAAKGARSRDRAGRPRRACRNRAGGRRNVTPSNHQPLRLGKSGPQGEGADH